jgi:hypothetical protein
MRPRNWCGAAAAVVACLLSAGCTSVSPHAGVGAAGAASSTPASTVTPALVSSTFGGVNFPHPAAWREVWPETQGAGPSYVIGYLTNQPAGRQCSTSDSGRAVACQAPVTVLDPGGVLVTVAGWGLAPLDFAAPTTIAGLPATRTISAAAKDCPRSANYEVQAQITITPPGAGGRLDIIVCAASSSRDQTREEIDAMFDTATRP